MGAAKLINRRRKFIYDVNTRNMSFREVAADLKRLGIKNNLFFLKLYDEDLVGIDPHNPMIPDEIKMKIVQECLINPWYFIREVVRIPSQGSNGVPFMLHRANLAIIFLFLLGIDNYVTIPRQCGKTQSIMSILLWAFLFGATGSEMLFVNIKEDGSINNLNRLKAQRELLPEYMRGDVALNDDGEVIDGVNKNIKKLINYANGNKVVTAPSATSESKADSIGYHIAA